MAFLIGLGPWRGGYEQPLRTFVSASRFSHLLRVPADQKHDTPFERHDEI